LQQFSSRRNVHLCSYLAVAAEHAACKWRCVIHQHKKCCKPYDGHCCSFEVWISDLMFGQSLFGVWCGHFLAWSAVFLMPKLPTSFDKNRDFSCHQTFFVDYFVTNFTESGTSSSDAQQLYPCE
jgi:hypothetical protein